MYAMIARAMTTMHDIVSAGAPFFGIVDILRQGQQPTGMDSLFSVRIVFSHYRRHIKTGYAFLMGFGL